MQLWKSELLWESFVFSYTLIYTGGEVWGSLPCSSQRGRHHQELQQQGSESCWHDVRVRIYNKTVTICNFKAVITFQHYFRSMPFVAKLQQEQQNPWKPSLAPLVEDEWDNHLWQVLKYPPYQRRRGQHKCQYRARLLPLLWGQYHDLCWWKGIYFALSHHGKARVKHIAKCPQCQPINWTKTSGGSLCAKSWEVSVKSPEGQSLIAHTSLLQLAPSRRYNKAFSSWRGQINTSQSN